MSDPVEIEGAAKIPGDEALEDYRTPRPSRHRRVPLALGLRNRKRHVFGVAP